MTEPVYAQITEHPKEEHHEQGKKMMHLKSTHPVEDFRKDLLLGWVRGVVNFK